MATKTTTTLTDDLDGSEAQVTLSYTWQGQPYEIDLNDANAQTFADALAPYLAASRKVGRKTGRATARRATTSPLPGATSGAATVDGVGDFDPKAVRAWAKDNGIELSPRGRLSHAILEQYRVAQ